MRSFSSRVREIVNRSDVILEIVDARNIKGTRLKSIERAVKRAKRELIIVVNKIDLYKPDLLALGTEDYVLMSAKSKIGREELMEKLNKRVKEKRRRRIIVGVIGYPDVGKSSIINYLIGRKKARTEFTPGSTRGEQYIKLSDSILLIDTPGVYAAKESQKSLALKFAYSADKLKDPVPVAMEIIEHYIKTGDDSFLLYYKVQTKNALEQDSIEIMERIGRKRGLLMKGGDVNITEVAKLIIRDYQKGSIPPVKKSRYN